MHIYAKKENAPDKKSIKEKVSGNDVTAVQMKKEYSPYSNMEQATDKKPNSTGIPGETKAKFESHSGFSFDDVRVHYNSEKPAQLRAHAYTQGNEVFVGPGQEKHLPHELGHVVQQKQGIVKPTQNVGGVHINADKSMERGADNIAQLASAKKAEPGENLKISGGNESKPIQGNFMSVMGNIGAVTSVANGGIGILNFLAGVKDWKNKRGLNKAKAETNRTNKGKADAFRLDASDANNRAKDHANQAERTDDKTTAKTSAELADKEAVKAATNARKIDPYVKLAQSHMDNAEKPDDYKDAKSCFDDISNNFETATEQAEEAKSHAERAKSAYESKTQGA